VTLPRLVSDRRLPSLAEEPIAVAPSMVEAISRAHAFAPAATPIVLYGESGSGKTFFAEYIHQLSQRSGGFHAFSVGTVAPQLALDELFGHVQGAYTDARKLRTGRIATAGGGTLLLDDLHTLDLGVQKQLLQVLDRGTYSPVGSDRVLSVACRIILAMTDSPERLMCQGQLLKDLRYRFGACEIRIPPLRERRAEILPLAERALDNCPRTTGVDGPSRLSQEAIRALSDASYEGNVRQLIGAIERSYLMARRDGHAEIGPQHLPEELCPLLSYRRHGDPMANRMAVERALAKTDGNVTEAAKLLGTSRNALYHLLASHRRKSEPLRHRP
jgi:DNA-binding NtrC family response regulator